jgi:hypothetical protein
MEAVDPLSNDGKSFSVVVTSQPSEVHLFVKPDNLFQGRKSVAINKGFKKHELRANFFQ